MQNDSLSNMLIYLASPVDTLFLQHQGARSITKNNCFCGISTEDRYPESLDVKHHIDLNYPTMNTKIHTITALDAAPRTTPSTYPEPFRSMMNGRVKRPLGDLFGLTNFGVNITVVAPGAVSALRHAHSKQDEFVYVVSGTLALYSGDGRTELHAGMCAGFKAGTGNAHQLVNETASDAVYLEVGDRTPGDEVSYPDDDLAARFVDGSWHFFHKDGKPYP